MSVVKTHKLNWKIALGLPVLIFIACFLITLTPKFEINSKLLSNAILVDLLVVAPFIYFLAIRKTNISLLTVARIFVAGVLVAGFILSSKSNLFLYITKTWLSPLIEAALIFFVVKKFYIVSKKNKLVNGSKTDFLLHCRTVMSQILGSEKFGYAIATEIAVLYYSIFGRKDKEVNNTTRFSSYKENGIGIILWSILFLFLIETAGTHLLLSIWSRTIASILTGLSIYTCLQIFAHIRALKARSTIINSDSLEIHSGLAGDAFIQFDNIESFELSKKMPQNRIAVKIALLKGMENHNVIVYLKKFNSGYKNFWYKKNDEHYSILR